MNDLFVVRGFGGGVDRQFFGTAGKIEGGFLGVCQPFFDTVG